MATGKVYYWIKLKDSFMTSDKVDFLMSQKDGANYIVLYQMLCLKCMNTGGLMARKIGEMLIPFDVDKVVRDCKYFSKDTVIVALELYKQLGMIYVQEDGMLCIADFDNMVGSETDYARKMREYREAKRLQCNQSVTDNVVDNVEDNVRQEIRDKRLEIRDKSIDNNLVISNDITCQTQDVRRCVEEWNSLVEYGIKSISRLDSNSKRYKSLVARINQYGIDDVLKAIDNIRNSDFLQGKHKGKPWQITFDWFVLPNNFPKVLEGNYSNGGNNNGSNGRIDAEDETEDEFTRLCREYGI